MSLYKLALYYDFYINVICKLMSLYKDRKMIGKEGREEGREEWRERVGRAGESRGTNGKHIATCEWYFCTLFKFNFFFRFLFL